MLRKIKVVFASFAIGVIMTSCVTITSPVMTTEAETGTGDKVGKSSYTTVLGIAFDRSRSLAEAAEDGNIDRISTVDLEIDPGLFSTTYTTIVTGK